MHRPLGHFASLQDVLFGLIVPPCCSETPCRFINQPSILALRVVARTGPRDKHSPFLILIQWNMGGLLYTCDSEARTSVFLIRGSTAVRVWYGVLITTSDSTHRHPHTHNPQDTPAHGSPAILANSLWASWQCRAQG